MKRQLEKLMGLEEMLVEIDSLSKRLEILIKLTTRRTRDPHTFIETIVGAVVDIFRI